MTRRGTRPNETCLPHGSDGLWLTDSGLETSLIFHDGMDLPEFASFVLLKTADGRARLKRYFAEHATIAARHGAGFVWESVTWRASPDWAEKLGYSRQALDDANRDAIEVMREVRADFAGLASVISGNIGPRGDGYAPEAQLSVVEAADYHSGQISVFAESGCDLISAFTMTHSAEALGIARVAGEHKIPCVLSFTVETDGRLPSGESLADAIARVDDASGGYPAYYMINCAHPSHFANAVASGESWIARIGGVRANASMRSHQELNDAPDLDPGDPVALSGDYARLLERLPALRVLGGCCGTDLRHISEIARTCLRAMAA